MREKNIAARNFDQVTGRMGWWEEDPEQKISVLGLGHIRFKIKKLDFRSDFI